MRAVKGSLGRSLAEGVELKVRSSMIGLPTYSLHPGSLA